MNRFIKKNICKILIALSLCLTLVLTLSFIPKTYAQVEDTNPYEILPNGIKSKNIWNEEFVIGNINPNNGSVESGVRVVSKDFIEIDNNTTYGTNQNDIGIAFYTSNYSFISFNWYVNYFTTPSNAKYIKFHMPGGYGSTYKYDIMIVKGNYIPSYLRYGFISGNNEYNWNNDLITENEQLSEQLDSIPRNYFTYIIGNNYFNNSNFTFNQSLNNFSGSLKIGSAPLNTPNTYIENNKLYLSQLFNYSYNNSKALDNNLNYVNVYNAPGYSTSNFTYLSIYPHYNLPSNERSGMSMPLKYVNLIIDGSNYNGSIRLTTQIPNGSSSLTYQYIDLSKNSDNNFVINYPDSENFLISIDIQATYSNGAYNIPTEIISNVEQVNAVSDYQVGYDTAKSEYGQVIAENNNSISNLQNQIEQNNQTIATLRQRVNDLQNQVNNNFGFQNVFFAMADTPFKTVSNFLGFELFGVNLFQALIGFITVLACIWLIKKLI